MRRRSSRSNLENEIGEQYYLVGPTVRGLIEEAQPCIIIVTVDRIGIPEIVAAKAPAFGGERQRGVDQRPRYCPVRPRLLG